MKGFYCSVVMLAAFCCLAAAASYPRVGKQPSSSNCFLESLGRMGGLGDWQPLCYGVYWNPQQCTTSGDCWCVDMNSGMSISISHHQRGEVNCFKTKHECESDQVFKTCPTECALQCSDLHTIMECPTGCKPPRCECPVGFLLNNGACVPSFSCPLACNTSLNEQLSHCPTSSCDVLCGGEECDDSPRVGCHPRCACAPGHVRNHDNVCVAPSQCPSLTDVAKLSSGTGLTSGNSPCHARVKKSLLCDEEGNFSATQCDGTMCFCSDPATGIPLDGTWAPIKDFDHDCATLTSCPAGTVFTPCAECPPTCDDPTPYCDDSTSCTPACACAQDTIRLSSVDSTCVKPTDCPAKSCELVKTFIDSSVICDKDGRWWPQQCDEQGHCYCVSRDGLRISDVSDGICDVIRECENTPGMMWSSCAPSCDDMCNRPPVCFDNSSATERDDCESRCACQPGHVLLIEENICVTRDRCPASAAPECDLELGEIWTDCDVTCEPTCEDPEQRDCRESTGVCVPGCACPPGTYRAPESRECVEFINCPLSPVCNVSLNEEWSDCAHQCDPTCEDRHPRCYLTRGCAHRCQCPNSYVRDSEGKCVKEESCNQPTPTLCQTERDEMANLIENFGLQDAFVPECNVTTGMFATMQCYGLFGNECWCVDPATGTELADTRTNAFDLDCDAAMTSSHEKSPPEYWWELPPIGRYWITSDDQSPPSESESH